MRLRFEEKARELINKPIIITDARGERIYKGCVNIIISREKANILYNYADELRMGSVRDIHKAAYIYLALGSRALEKKEIYIETNGKKIDSELLFHFAGHAFREIGQFNRAADAYSRAEAIAVLRKKYSFSARSFARAKMAYQETGEIEKSEAMHVMEWESRFKNSKRIHKKIMLGLWRMTSLYGTSFRRWFFCWLISIGIFTAIYEYIHALKLIDQHEHWKPWVTALYYSIVTTSTLGYGDFVPNDFISQLIVILNVFSGYVLMGLGLTILGRKALKR